MCPDECRFRPEISPATQTIGKVSSRMTLMSRVRSLTFRTWTPAGTKERVIGRHLDQDERIALLVGQALDDLGGPRGRPALPFRSRQDTVHRFTGRGELGKIRQPPHGPAVVEHHSFVFHLY